MRTPPGSQRDKEDAILKLLQSLDGYKTSLEDEPLGLDFEEAAEFVRTQNLKRERKRAVYMVVLMIQLIILAVFSAAIFL